MRPVIEFLAPETLEFLEGTADYTSFSWENKTDGSGSFEIHIPRELSLTHGIIVHLCREGIPEAFGIATCIRIESGKTVIMGSMLSRVFDWRYMQNDGPEVTLSTDGGVGKLICLCAKYGCLGDNANDFFGKSAEFEYPESQLPVEIRADMKSSCLELMTSVARDGGCCFGVTVNNGRIKVFSYDYTDRGRVIDAALTADGFVYTSSCDSERNVFGYSLGNSESGYTYRTSSAENFSGTKRRMLNLGRFETAPTGIIREKTALLTPTESVEAKLRLRYPQDFSLGEIVTLKNGASGFSRRLAVTAVREIWEDKYSCDTTFGIPQETVHRKLLRTYL